MPRILIVTAEPKNFVPVELAKAAGELGIEAKIINITDTVLVEEVSGSSSENYQLESAVYVTADCDAPETEASLVKVEVCPDTYVIPRLNEYHTEIKLGILKRLQMGGAKLINSPESMELCNDKLMTQVVLNSAGIKTPYSAIVQNPDKIEMLVDALEKSGKLKYPFVIKTLRGTHGIGVMKVDSRSSLISVAQMLAKEQIDFMLQEFCKHDRSARIIMIGDQVLAANLRGQPKEKDEFRTNSHLGSVTDPYEPGEEEIAIARKIVELFGSNFCAIDYLITETKELIVLEVNGSPGLENIQKNWPEKNLAKMVVQKFTGVESRPDASPVAPPSDVQISQTEDPASTKQEIAQDQMAQADSRMPDNAISDIEQCVIHRITQEPVACRIDTGAKMCCLHADKIEFDEDSVKFTRGNITFKVPVFRMALIRNASGGPSVRRPVVKLDISINGIRANQVEFTLTDRSHMKYEVLVGRSALSCLNLPIIVSAQPGSNTTSEESQVEVEEE